MRPFFLLGILKSEAKRNNFILKSLAFSFLFIFLAVTLINYKSYISFITADYPFIPKIQILFLIFFGSFVSMAQVDVILLFVTAILFGVNLELIVRKIAFLKNQTSLGLTFGVGIISIAVTGCASCGLSIISFVGIAGVIAFLPFGGLGLYALSIGILLTSLFYNLNTLVKVCKLT